MRLNEQYSWNSWCGAWNIVVASTIACQLLQVADISVDRVGPAILAASSPSHTAAEQEPLGGVSWRSQQEAPRTPGSRSPWLWFISQPAPPCHPFVQWTPLTKDHRDGVIWGEEETVLQRCRMCFSSQKGPRTPPLPSPPKQLLWVTPLCFQELPVLRVCVPAGFSSQA